MTNALVVAGGREMAVIKQSKWRRGIPIIENLSRMRRKYLSFNIFYSVKNRQVIAARAALTRNCGKRALMGIGDTVYDRIINNFTIPAHPYAPHIYHRSLARNARA